MIGRLLATALAVLLPSVAAAHSEHGDPTSVGSQNVFAVPGYRVEVLSHPSPLTRGHPSHVVTRVLTTATLAPVIGGRLLIGVAPTGTVGEAMLAPEEAQVTPERTGAHQVLIFTVAGIVLLQQPMGMRHGM